MEADRRRNVFPALAPSTTMTFVPTPRVGRAYEEFLMSIGDFPSNECTEDGLDETDLHPNPFEQFRRWMERALQADLPEPCAMTLATVAADGKPSARMVL